MKCRNIEARDLARRLIKGETITREMASSHQVWAMVRNSALGVAAAYHAKLIKAGVSAERRRAWLQRQHERVEATFSVGRQSALPSWLIASLGEVDAVRPPPPFLKNACSR
jgi:hypothetical protein